MILFKKDNLIVTILFCIVAFTMPFGLVNNINPISIILLTVYTVFLAVRDRHVSFSKSPLQILPLLYFFFLVFTLVYSENLSESAKQVEKSLSFFLFPFLFFKLNNYTGSKTTKSILFSFVLGNVLALFICLCYSLYMFYFELNTDPLLKGSFYFTQLFDLHPTYFSMYLIMCIVFIRTYIHENKINLKSFRKVLLIGLTFFLWISILHLKSRSSILALILVEIILVTVFLLNKYPKIYKRTFWLFFVAFVTLILFLSINGKVSDYGNAYFKRDTNAAIDDRLKNWEASLDAVSEAPILGNGLYGSSMVRDKYFYINGYDIGIDNQYNSHNQFIETTIIGGVIGLVILLLLLFKLLVLFKKNNQVSVLCFFTLLIAVMMTESILVRQHGIVFFSFFYVLFNTRLK